VAPAEVGLSGEVGWHGHAVGFVPVEAADVERARPCRDFDGVRVTPVGREESGGIVRVIGMAAPCHVVAHLDARVSAIQGLRPGRPNRLRPSRGEVTRRCSDARRSASTLLRCRHDSVFRWAWAGVKAVVYERYGSSDVLRLEDVPVPSPAAGQVRVRVAATSVNLSDWEA
jgi:hypothetical protein